MPEGLRKIWMYIIPLGLLAVIATCDTDFNIKNPFSEDDVNDTISGLKMKEDSLSNEQDGAVDSLAYIGKSGSEPQEDSNASKPEYSSKAVNGGKKMWRLIIGSVPEKEKAERLAVKSGYPDVKLMYIEDLQTYRLVYGSYDDIRDAQQAFSEIQGRFPEAWMVFF